MKLIRDAKFMADIDKIRTLLAQGNLTSVRSRKKKLPALCFSGILHDSLLKTDVNSYTNLMVIDIDKLGEHLNEVKERIKADPNIMCVWTSPSGNGLKALLYTEYTAAVSKEDFWIIHQYCAFPQIADYFLNEYQMLIDKTGCDITQLCFISADSEIHLKKEFQPFPVNITLSSKEINKIRNDYYSRKSVKKARKQQRKLQKQIAAQNNS